MPRSNPHAEPTRPARKGREVEPDWARGLSSDEALAEQEARRLSLDSDPEEIEDEEVRRRFVRRLQEDEAEAEGRISRAAARSGRRPAGSAGRAAPSRASGRGRRGPTTPVGRPTLRPPRRLTVADGSGFALGLVLYALALNYLRFGMPGVTGWIRAKFINQPATDLGRRPLGGRGQGPGAAAADIIPRRRVS